MLYFHDQTDVEKSVKIINIWQDSLKNDDDDCGGADECNAEEYVFLPFNQLKWQ